MARTVEEMMARLAALGDEKRRAINAKNGAGENQFGVPMGEIRKLAAEIKSDHALGMGLWGTGNIDAQLLGILLIKPKTLSAAELDGMVRAGRFGQVADWLGSYVIGQHPGQGDAAGGLAARPRPVGGPARLGADGGSASTRILAGSTSGRCSTGSRPRWRRRRRRCSGR